MTPDQTRLLRIGGELEVALYGISTALGALLGQEIVLRGTNVVPGLTFDTLITSLKMACTQLTGLERVIVVDGASGLADAGIRLFVVPYSLDVRKERGRWRQWLVEKHPSEVACDFGDWLLREGAREATEADITVIAEAGD